MNIRKIICTLLFLIIGQNLFAQTTRYVQLKPIYKQGTSYFYDTKRVHTAYALQIPFQASEDEDVIKHFNRFRTWQTARRLVYLPVFLVPIYVTGNRSSSSFQTFFYMYLGAAGLDIAMGGLAHNQMRKAIDLYNISIHDNNSFGLWLDGENPVHNTVNLGWKIKL